MEMPCQKVIWYLLPALRREIAKTMVEMGKKQNEIADKLGVTEAAVSQYIKGKRGYFEFPENIQTIIYYSTIKIIKEGGNEMLIMKELCRICKYIRKENIWNELDKKLK